MFRLVYLVFTFQFLARCLVDVIDLQILFKCKSFTISLQHLCFEMLCGISTTSFYRNGVKINILYPRCEFNISYYRFAVPTTETQDLKCLQLPGNLGLQPRVKMIEETLSVLVYLFETNLAALRWTASSWVTLQFLCVWRRTTKYTRHPVFNPG